MRRLLAVAAVAALAAGCGIFEDDPVSGPTQTTTVIVNTGPTSPASPSPAPAASPGTGTGSIAEVRVVMVGTDTCPPGITPANAQRTVRVGCSAFITCTPKVRLPSGELVDASPAVHGTAPTSFGLGPGPVAFTFTAWDSNAFNADIRAVAPGAAVIACTVGGVTGSNIFVAAP